MVTSQVNKYTSTQVYICSSSMPSKWSADTYLFIREHFCTMHSQLYSVQHFYWRNMKIAVVFSNVQNYSLDNLQHKLCVHFSELVREVCEEKGHCHYYTVIWLFCESHPIYNGRPSTRKTKRQPRTRFFIFSDDFVTSHMYRQTTTKHSSGKENDHLRSLSHLSVQNFT